MKFGEVVVHMDTTTSPSFIKKGWKTKKVLLIAHFWSLADFFPQNTLSIGSSFAFRIDDLKQVFGGSVKILSR